MAHRQVSKTRTSATGCVRTHYWLKPPCLLARCPISCQNSRKLSSPSLFLSNDLMSWSTTAGSAESCRKTGRDWTCVIYNQPAPVSHSGGCSVEIQLVRACVCALAHARARVKKGWQSGATDLLQRKENATSATWFGSRSRGSVAI